MENENLDIIALAPSGQKHDLSVPDGKITELKLSDEVKDKLNNATSKTDIVDNLEDTSSDKPISARAVNVDMVNYVDASISDAMLYINRTIDEVEEVTATALCALDSRVTTNTTNIAVKGDKILISNETASSKEIEPNKFYKWGTVSALTITLKTPTDNTIINEYMFEFVSGSTATSLTLPATVEGIDTTAIEANKIYHVSIVNNVGVIYGVDNA